MIDISLVLESSHNQHISSPNYVLDTFYWSFYNTTEQVPERQAWQNCETKIECIDDWICSADEKTWTWIGRMIITSESSSVTAGRHDWSPGLLILALSPSFTCIQSSVLVLPWAGFLWATENMLHFSSVHSYWVQDK